MILKIIDDSIWLRNLFVATLIFVGTSVSHLSEFEFLDVTVIWPVGAINVWLMYRYGIRALPACFVGYEAYHHLLHTSAYGLYLPILSLTNSLTSWFATSLYRSITPTQSSEVFKETKSLLSFVLITAAVMSVSSAVVGNSVLIMFGLVEVSQLTDTFFRWLLSDFTGVILCCPALMLLGSQGPKFNVNQVARYSLVVAVTLLVVWFVASNFSVDQYPTILLVLPVCGWLALQADTRAVAIALTVLLLGCLLVTLAANESLMSQDLLLVPLYAAAIMIFALLLHAIDKTRNELVDELIFQKASLQSAVDERTRELTEKMNEADRLAAVLEHQSQTDYLTEVLNRRGFERALNEQIALLRRYKRAFSLLVFDLDYFKKVNDQYGHKAGDDCLVSVVRCVQTQLRQGVDQIARLGGEEFACLLPETELSGALQQADRFRRSVEQLAIESEGHTFSVTISVGVVTSGTSIESSYKLMSRADAALYRAKSKGRNCVES